MYKGYMLSHKIFNIILRITFNITLIILFSQFNYFPQFSEVVNKLTQLISNINYFDENNKTADLDNLMKLKEYLHSCKRSPI